MKKRIAWIVLLALATALCCATIVACKPSGTTYTLTWDVDPHVTATVEGYDTLPTSAAEGAELKLTLTPASGWTVSTVTPARYIKRESDGTYTVTVGQELSIKVSAKEILESIVVEQEKPLYAGYTIQEGDLTVKAHYATGNETPIPFGNYTVDYGSEEATALTLGQTKITIGYEEMVKEFTFEEPIKGLIKVDFFGGDITEDIINTFKDYPGYAYDETKGVISWEFTEALAEAIVLPVPTKSVNGIDFPFLSWDGADNSLGNWRILDGLDTSKTYTAVYDAQLVLIESMAFSLEEETDNGAKVYVPYLTVNGEFIAAESAYLYLYEGNDKVELKGTEVEKVGTDPTFVLKFDLRDLVDSGYINKWMDIKFCAKFDEVTETQEINLTDYDYADDFIDLNDTVRSEVDGSWYNFSYEVHTPDNSSKRLLKLVYNNAMPWDLISAELVQHDREVPGEGDTVTNVPTAYLKISGVVDEHATFTVESLKTAVEATFFEVLSNGDWKQGGGTVVVTVTDATHFYLEYNLNNLVSGKEYFAHYINNENNLKASVCPVTAGTVTIDSWTYTLSDNSTATVDWIRGLVWITAVDANKVDVGTEEYDVVIENGKAYLVINGTDAKNKTGAQIKGEIGQIDFELDGSNGATKVLVDEAKIEVTVNSDQTFVVKAEIPELAPGKYWTHAVGLIPDNGDMHPKGSANATDSDGKVYKYLYEWRETWGAQLLEVKYATVVEGTSVTSAKLEVEDAKLYYIIEGSVKDGYTKENVQNGAICFDLQDRGGSWVKHTFTGTITVDDDGKVTVKIDISGLAEFTNDMEHFTTHFEVAFGAQEGGDLKPDIDSFQQAAVEFNGKNYVLRFVKDATEDSDFWGCVGIDVSNA